jgi:hypothetical protein
MDSNKQQITFINQPQNSKVLYMHFFSGGPEGRHIGGLLAHLGDIPLAFIAMKIGYDLATKK